MHTDQSIDLSGQCSWLPGSRPEPAPRNDDVPASFRSLLDRKSGPPRRQADAGARSLNHVVARHLHDVGAPIKLLRLVFEKIDAGKSIAISLDVASGGLSGNRC